MWQLVKQKKAEHATFAVRAEGHALRCCCGLQTVNQGACLASQVFIKTGFLDLAQGGEPAGRGHGVAAQRTSLVNRTHRGHHLHHGALGAKCSQRHAPANDLAHHRQIRLKAGDLAGIHTLRAAQGHPKTGHDLIKHQQGTVFRAEFAATFHEGHRGAHKVHVAGNRLNHQAGQLAPVQHKGFFELHEVVVFQHQRVLHHLRGHARAGGVAKGGQPRAGLDQERIGVAVVAAFKLDQLAAPGGAPCQADGAHGGFGAGADQAHHVHAGHDFQDFFSQFHLALGRGAKREALQHRSLYGLHHRRMAVAQNHGSPRANVVRVALVIGVPKISALGPFDKTRRATHSLERPDGRIDTAGNHFSGAFKEGVVVVSVGCHWACAPEGLQ